MNEFTSQYLKRREELSGRQSGFTPAVIPLPTFSNAVTFQQRTKERTPSAPEPERVSLFRNDLLSKVSGKRVPDLSTRLRIRSESDAMRAEDLTRERRDILGFNPAPTQEQRNRVAEIDREREALRQRSGQLREDARWAEYGQLRYQPDFSANSSRPRSALDDMRRRVGGEAVDERYLVGLEHAGGVGSMEWIERARQLTDDELAMYNYLRNTEGQESADAYLDLMEETLNQRVGGKQAEDIANIENPLLRTAATGAYAVGSGLDQFGTGVKQLFTEEALPTTATQFGAAQVREDLADASPSIGGKPLVLPGGASLGQAAFDLVSSAANMAPGLALSAATAGAGAAPWLSGLAASGSLGAAAGGNAYNEAVKQGYTPAQARSYAILTGASEGGLQYLLGGIGALGGRVSRNVISKTVQNIDNALLRAGAELGLSMLSEGAEEYLQEVLTPVFRNIALDENNPVELVSEEAIYAGILGALSAGVLEGPGRIGDAVTSARSGGTRNGPVRAAEPGQAAEFAARAERAAAGSAGPAGENGGAMLTAEDISWILSQIDQASTEQGQNSTAASTGETAALRGDVRELTLPGGEEIPISQRTWQDASNRKVNAFQYDHPELRPYYQSAARALLSDLSSAVRGERFPTYDQDGYVTGYTGVKRSVSEPIEQALDNANLSYAQIQKAAEDLIADNGQENYAAAKKLELILDQMLSEGYTDAEGRFVPADEAYIALRDGQPVNGSEYRMSEEEWNSIMSQEPAGLPSAFNASPEPLPVLERVLPGGDSGVVRMSLDEYLGRQGLSAPISDYMDDKLRLPHGETQRQRARREADANAAADDYTARRQAAIQEYNQKVQAGEITPKSRIERLIETARGHDDNESVQAARRALEKRGIDWRVDEDGGPLYDKGPESSVGAARSGFDPWSAFQLTRSEFFPEGANATRPVDVPTTDPQGRRIRKTASTAMGAKAIPDEVVGDIQNMVLRGELSYTRRSDKASVENAIKTIGDKGFQRALEDFSAQVRKGYVSKDMATLGQQLLINAANAGDSDATAEILSLYAQMETSAGQAVQAASILRKLDPSSQLYAAQRAVSDLEAEIRKEFKDIDITIDQALIDEFDRQTDQAGRDAVLDRIKDNVAAQVPSTWQDKWNAWRYLAMLSNPRTHVRNFSGNVFFQPLRITKDRLAAAIEAGVSKATGGKVERTKTFLADKNLYKAAWHDWENVRDVLSGNRYDDLKSEINSRRTIYNKGLPTKALETLTGRTFKRGILENVRTANSWTLEIEDTIFKRFTYTDALAGYLQAHGVTAEQLRGGTADSRILSAARDYAGREALKATYQDRNQFSDYISSVGRGRNAPGWAKVVTEGVLPFRRTPANILMRGLEYSPAGLAKALTYDLAQVKRGKKTAAEVIDNIAAGLTGSTLFGLGMYLFAQGIVTSGGGDDEGQDQLDEQEGRQAYALNLPGGDSITLDWLAPESLPFFMGVEWMESIGESGITAEGAFDSFASAASPMLELSMLQSLNDLIDSVSFADSVDKVPSVVISALISYFTQAIPTIGGQFERSAEDNRMTTYTDKNLKLPTDIQYALGKASARIPGWDYQQIPFVDGWGRTESSGHWLPRAGNQFLNPAYTSSDTSTPAIQETRRLYEETGDGGVVSKRPEKEVTVDGQTKYLSAGEYLQYATERGEMREQLVTDIIGRDAYQDMGAAEQAAVIRDVYFYTDEVAKSHISEYEPSSWVKKVEAYGVDPADAILYRAAKRALEDADVEGVTQELRSMLMEDTSLTSGEKAAIDKAILSEKSQVDYSSQESFLISQMSDAAQSKWPGIRDRFGLSAEEYQEAVRIYNMDKDDGVTTADKKRILREMFGWEGNAIYKALGKKADSDEED